MLDLLSLLSANVKGMYHKPEGLAFCYVNCYKIFLSLNNWYTILWRSFEPTVAECHFLWSRCSTTKPPRLDDIKCLEKIYNTKRRSQNFITHVKCSIKCHLWKINNQWYHCREWQRKCRYPSTGHQLSGCQGRPTSSHCLLEGCHFC